MTYLTVLFLNILSLLLYYRIAIRFDIIDQPNERSSHDYLTVRGAGIIILITSLFWALFSTEQHLYIVIGLSSIGLISLIDDIITLPNKLRFVVHIFAVLLVFQEIGLFSSNIFIVLGVLILYLGWINAFNFMDGINGITSFYTLSILLPLYLVMQVYSPAYTSLIIYLSISVIVFMFMNVRAQALAFCGDVGAVVLAYIIAYLVIGLIIMTGRLEFILFGSVYGVDAILTIIRRLAKGENIFQPHRTHLYQMLSNELNWHYLLVSFIYSITQLLISMIVIFAQQRIPQHIVPFSVALLLVLGSVYLISLNLVQKKIHSIPQ